MFLGRSSKVRKHSSPLRPMGWGGNDPRDFRVIYLGAIGRRRVAPDMGAAPVHAALVLTGTAGAAADRPCSRFSSSPPRLLACRFLSTHRYIAASHYQGRARRRESWAWVFARQGDDLPACQTDAWTKEARSVRGRLIQGQRTTADLAVRMCMYRGTGEICPACMCPAPSSQTM